MASFAGSTSGGVDRRYEFGKGYRPTAEAIQAKRLAQRFLARSRYDNHVGQAFGSSTGAERGTGGIGSGVFGSEDTPQQLSAPVITALRNRDKYDSKIDFLNSDSRADRSTFRPQASRGEFYSLLRAPAASSYGLRAQVAAE